jgi:two-component system, sensor histidine kinase
MHRQNSGNGGIRDTSRPEAASFLVLVVEDNLVNQQILAHYLSSFGVAYEFASNGQEAVDAIRTGRYSMVLMDIQMPIMDGISATLAIRALPGPESQIPIFAVTAHSGPEQDASYIKVGMNGVIAKPVPAALLHNALRTVGRLTSA